MNPLLVPLLLPVVAAFSAAFAGERFPRLRCFIALAAALASFVVACGLFGQGELYTLPWVGFGFDFTLRIYPFAGFALLLNCAAAVFASVYCWTYMEGKPRQGWFYFSLLLALGFANGAVLADNFGLLLFFWLGLLLPAYLFVALADRSGDCKAAALKTLLLNSCGGLFLLAGIAITGVLTGTMSISSVAVLPVKLQGWGIAGLLFFCLGLLAKLGIFPFHTYEEEAAAFAPVPASFFIAALDKILGVYLLIRVCSEFYVLTGAVLAYPFLLIAGVLTVLAGAGAAVVRDDSRRIAGALLTAQSGYVLIALANGDSVTALLQLLVALLSACCLFFAAGAADRATRTSRLQLLGGSFPALAGCVALAAAGLGGFLPLGGSFSQLRLSLEVLRGGHAVLFGALLFGGLLNMAALLRLVHSFFAGPKTARNAVPRLLTVCSAALAILSLAGCLWFKLPSLLFALTQPGKLFDPQFFPFWQLAAVALVPLALAALWQFLAPGLLREEPLFSWLCGLAERRVFDPYNYLLHAAFFLGRGFYVIDRAFDFVTSAVPACVAGIGSLLVAKLHGLRISYYFTWLLFGLVIFCLFVSYYGVMP